MYLGVKVDVTSGLPATVRYSCDLAGIGAALIAGEPIHFIDADSGEPYVFKPGLSIVLLENAYPGSFKERLEKLDFDTSAITHPLKISGWMPVVALYVKDNVPYFLGSASDRWYFNADEPTKFVGCLDSDIYDRLNIDVSELHTLRNDSRLHKYSNYDIFICKDYIRYKTWEYRHDIKRFCYVSDSELSNHKLYQQTLVDILLDQSEYHGPFPYIQLPKNRIQQVILFDTTKEEKDTFSDCFRTPVTPGDIETLKTLISNSAVKSLTDDTNFEQYEGPTISICDGYLNVAIKSAKEVKRNKETKKTRQITTLQSYFASIVAAIILKKDIVLPEGGIYNTLTEGFTYSEWYKGLKPDSSNILESTLSDATMDTIESEIKYLASKYKTGTTKSVPVGGNSTPLTETLLTVAMAHSTYSKSYLNKIISLDCKKSGRYGFGGLARTMPYGISLTDKTLGFKYLVSRVFGQGFNFNDQRCNGYNNYKSADERKYREDLKYFRRQFYDCNILPNEHREELIADITGLHERYSFDIDTSCEVVRFREIFTLPLASIDLLDSACKNFKSITELCQWWRDTVPKLESIVDSGILNESETNKAKILFQVLECVTRTLIAELDGE